MWTLDGWWHREDGPACIVPEGVIVRLYEGLAHDHPDGELYEGPVELWAHHGRLHREDGPAVCDPPGTKLHPLADPNQYWLWGEQMAGKREWKRRLKEGPATDWPHLE